MAKKTTLTDNQIMILFHAGRGDLADVCDLSVDADGRYGQDVAYLQAKGFLTPRSDTVPKTTDMGEIAIARLVAAKHSMATNKLNFYQILVLLHAHKSDIADGVCDLSQWWDEHDAVSKQDIAYLQDAGLLHRQCSCGEPQARMTDAGTEMIDKILAATKHSISLTMYESWSNLITT